MEISRPQRRGEMREAKGNLPNIAADVREQTPVSVVFSHLVTAAKLEQKPKTAQLMLE